MPDAPDGTSAKEVKKISEELGWQVPWYRRALSDSRDALTENVVETLLT